MKQNAQVIAQHGKRADGIVTQGHGGTLTVESDEGKGATFIITLPTDSRT